MHNFKKKITIILFLAVLIAGNSILTFLFYPYQYARIDVHNIETAAYDTVFLGSSHGKCGINPEVIDAFTGGKSINACMGGEYMQDVYFLAKEAVRRQQPKRVVYELDPGYWVTEPTQGMDYASFYHELPWSTVKLQYFAEKMADADFRTILFPWYVFRQKFALAPKNAAVKMSDIYRSYDPAPFDNEAQTYEGAGFIRRKVVDAPKTEENLVLWDETQLQDESLAYFQRLVQLCEEEGVELIVITTPVPDVTYDKYRQQFDDANTYFSEYLKQYQVPYYNFNYLEMNGFDRSLDAYADYEGHMYGDSADVFSEILAGYL